MDTNGHEYDWEIRRLENLPAVKLWHAGQKVAASDKCQLSCLFIFLVSFFQNICVYLRSSAVPFYTL
jgi:hypothetical protein